MTITIADLAVYAEPPRRGYRARADWILDEYKNERAREMESDVWDHWARIRFGDGSEIIVLDAAMHVYRHA